MSFIYTHLIPSISFGDEKKTQHKWNGKSIQVVFSPFKFLMEQEIEAISIMGARVTQQATRSFSTRVLVAKKR